MREYYVVHIIRPISFFLLKYKLAIAYNALHDVSCQVICSPKNKARATLTNKYDQVVNSHVKCKNILLEFDIHVHSGRFYPCINFNFLEFRCRRKLKTFQSICFRLPFLILLKILFFYSTKGFFTELCMQTLVLIFFNIQVHVHADTPAWVKETRSKIFFVLLFGWKAENIMRKDSMHLLICVSVIKLFKPLKSEILSF